MKVFHQYHPLVLFLYFISTIMLTMLTMNPIILTISFVSSILYAASIHKSKAFLSGLGFYLPMFVLIALTNPLFSHNGVTILFFLNNNAVTLEAILYGVAIAGMLLSVMVWFSSYHQVFTSDKVIYLFGTILPSIALMISMGMKFIPVFLRQLRKLNQTQRTFGLYAQKGIVNRFVGASKVLSAMIGIALEQAVDTANSMKARGYGLGKRTTYTLVVLRRSDVILLGLWIIVMSSIAVFWSNGLFAFYYYPVISNLNTNHISLIAYSVIGLWMLIPVILEVKENLKWRYLKSKI